jgi:hypothetical protein
LPTQEGGGLWLNFSEGQHDDASKPPQKENIHEKSFHILYLSADWALKLSFFLFSTVFVTFYTSKLPTKYLKFPE